MSVARDEMLGEVRATVSLAWPLVLGMVGQNLLGLADTAIMGRLGPTELAGVAVANSIFFTIALTATGVVMGLDPIASQAVGAKEGARAHAALLAGIRVALAVALPSALLMLLAPLTLTKVGVAEPIAAAAGRFLYGRAPSVIPFAVYGALRCSLQARNVATPMLWGSVVANVVNVALNLLLVFGDGGLASVGLPRIGLPALGPLGCGLASSCASLSQVAVLAYAYRALPRLEGGGDTDVRARRIAALGAPIALTLLAEVGAFGLVSVLASRISAESGSGHQVAIQLASFTFTFSLGLSSATCVRVGQAVGRGDAAGVRRAGWVGLGISALYMGSMSAVFFLLGEPLARALTTSEAVVLVAVPLLHVAAAFQLFDGAQVVAAGALRGLGDTKFAQWANLFGYYVVAMPFGAFLAFRLGMAERGLWWGLSSGLATVALLLVGRFAALSKRPIVRAG